MSLEKLPRGPFFGSYNISSFLASFASLVTHNENSREHEVAFQHHVRNQIAMFYVLGE